MPAQDLKYVTDNLRENGESLPGKRDRFDGCCDSSLPPSYFDGDWPDWPEQTMLHFMPPAIVKKYCQTPCSALNGFYLVLRMSDADEILKALERDGQVPLGRKAGAESLREKRIIKDGAVNRFPRGGVIRFRTQLRFGSKVCPLLVGVSSFPTQ